MKYLFQYYNSFFLFIAKERLRNNDVEQWRIHAHIIMVFNTSILMWSYAVIAHLTIEHPAPMYVGYAASMVHLLSPLIFRISKNIYTITNISLGAGLSHQATFAYFTGGFESNIIIWFSILPLLAGVICGKKGILIWATIAIIVTAIYLTMSNYGYVFPNLISANGFIVSQSFITFGWVIVNSIVIWSYILFIEKNNRTIEAANKAKSDFLTNMSHELRTPLNAIIGYSELVKEELEEKGESTSSKDLETINRAGLHLLSLINGILDLSKIEADKMDTYIESFNIKDLINEVSVQIKPLIDKNNNTLVIEYDININHLSTDKTKLKQILFNLLSNSAKFTDNGTITLHIYIKNSQDDVINFSVTDTGIGMTEQQLSKIFKNFSQADSSIVSKFGGTGLGLLISKQFCDLINGTIQVKSILGIGTTFTIQIPLKET